MGVAALVLGIFGTVLSLVPYVFYAGLALSTLALVLGVVARKSAIQRARPSGTATAGLVLGVVGLAVGLTMWAVCYQATRGTEHAIEDFQKKMTDPAVQKRIQKDNADFDKTFKDTFGAGLEEPGKKEEKKK